MQLYKGIFPGSCYWYRKSSNSTCKKRIQYYRLRYSETIINKNRIYYENKYLNIKFIVDNILNSNLESNNFDFIFDRGCFHVFREERSKYYKEVKRIIKEKGILFLKCLSSGGTAINAGNKFTTEEIHDIFGSDFTIQKISKTFYQDTFDPLPKALFTEMILIKK